MPNDDASRRAGTGWQPELDELRRREGLARAMGGPDKVRRQHEGGRLTIRERIDRLVDPGSFREVGTIAGTAHYDAGGNLQSFVPSNRVSGRAMIDGRPVIVSGDDFTVRGGSADATIPEKTVIAERMANELRLPLIRIVEGSGGGGSVKTIETTGRANLPGGLGGSSGRYKYMTDNLGIVPVVALGLGSVAGLGAAQVAASHYSVMTKSTSAMFVAGPPVVARIGEKQSLEKQQLGGWEIQCSAGAIDDAVDTEEEAFERVRRFLSYLPSSVFEVSPRGPRHDPPSRRDERLFSVIPRDRNQPYKMRPIIEALVDQGSFFEMGRHFGRPVITAFARLDGLPVAILASDPFHMGGAWTADACQKVVRAVDLAETFHLPIVHLVDCPGFMIGLEAERAATIRHGVRAMAAINQSTVPWCSIIIRNVFGVAGAAHVPAGRLALRYAWLSAWWGSLPLEGGIEAAYRAEVEAADDPKAKLAEIEGRLNALRSPFRTAESFWVEEIIDPRETRPLLCEFANLAEPLRTPGLRTFGMRP
ncbi:MAG TPA: carboxyl transferase domain-containing protein [Hyphomicrobiaceae bacterium]|nr:carboxyl transferase domain-containing protein [Hyphomicrobiaceae bacterium]